MKTQNKTEKYQGKYLGHKVSDSTVSVDPGKTQAIHTWLESSCMHEL